jgi:hypothetical protein
MADKPRVKAPKQRSTHAPDDAERRRRMLVLGGGALLAIAAVAAALSLLGTGGSDTSAADARTSLEAAGCELQAVESLGAAHSVTDPGGTSDAWNTDPPTSGPHYGVAAIFGIYEEPLEMARLVHNLEHGGVFILYGDEVPSATVDELRGFYDDHKAGTLMAPLPRLGDEFALGAWNADPGETGNAYLAKCTSFDDAAVSDFFSAFQFRGPERFDPEQLQPGH